jgi:CheY-like chemotaxis protein
VVVGDGGRLRQILLNLVGNAVKFTEAGEVVVQVDPVSSHNASGELHFRVIDTGIGIPLDKQASIFEAFTQADGSTTRRFGGTGLGLTISATLASLMGGRLWVESAPGAGSTFHFTLAADVPDAAVNERRVTAFRPSLRTSAPRRPGRAAVPRRVLLAEDNEVNQSVAVGLLSRRGHHMTVAWNGQEALDLLERGPFDLVLMDLQMPVMGGIEATAAIRERERVTGRHTRIVAMTAHAMSSDRDRCLRAGMDGYLSKPVDPDMLFAVVERDSTGSDASTPHRRGVATAFDEDALLTRVQGDTVLMMNVIRIFLEDCPARLADINAAVAARDAIALRAAAHALKGAAGNLAAVGLFEAAQVLERVAAEDRMDAAEAARRRLSAEAANVMDILRRYENPGIKEQTVCAS